MVADSVRQLLRYIALAVGLTVGSSGVPELPKNVKVTVVCILASGDSTHIDPELVNIAKEIQKKKPELKCFKLKCMSAQSLSVGKEAVFKLVDKQQARVLIKQSVDKNHWVGLQIKPPLQGWIAYESVCGKFLPIVTRYETDKGERLILAVRVQPCNGGK